MTVAAQAAGARVLIVAPYPWTFGLSTFYARAFRKIGADVRMSYSAPQNSWSSTTSRVRAAAMARSRTIHDWFIARVEQRHLDDIKDYKPHLILVISGSQLRQSFLVDAKRLSGAPVVHLHPDNPFYDHGYTSTFFETLPVYDCVFTFARFLVAPLYQCGARRVEHLPFAYDPEVHAPTAAAQRNGFESPIAYLGTWGPIVEKWLMHLEPFGLKIWGLSWNHLAATSPLRACWQQPGTEERGMGTTMGHVCGSSKLIFNVTRAEHGCAHSMKTFEIPACGGFLLTNRSDEQLEILAEDQEAVYFSTADELVDKARFYLQNDHARERIAAAGRARVAHETYGARAQRMWTVSRELESVHNA